MSGTDVAARLEQAKAKIFITESDLLVRCPINTNFSAAETVNTWIYARAEDVRYFDH
jgi:hypothetical protein